MKEKSLKTIETFNRRLEALFEQACKWLDEAHIEYSKAENEMSLTEGKDMTYSTKRLDVFTKEGESLFSIVPYGVWIVGAEGRVELEGDSGSESMVYLLEDGPAQTADQDDGEKENIIRRKLNGFREEGWHWVDERIVGKRPLLTKDIFLALLERIN
jgi:hypothetical protein